MKADLVPSSSQTAILARLVLPREDQIAAATARGLLAIRFDQGDLDRIRELLEKNGEGLLTAAEQMELDNYCQVSYLLDLIHSRARRAP